MSKWYEVTVSVQYVYAVEVEDHETASDAIRYALDEAPSSRDGAIAEANEITEPHYIEDLIKDADEVLKL